MKKIERILQIIPNLLTGGAERFVVDLSNKLAQKYEVRLILFYSPDALPNQILLNDLDAKIKVEFLGKKTGFDFSVFSKLKKIIKDYNPSVIHTHLGVFRYVAPVLLLMRRYKAIHTVHNDAEREAAVGKKDILYRNFMYKRRYIFPVTISEANSVSFRKYYPGIGFSMIYNGRTRSNASPEINKVRDTIEGLNKTSLTRIFIFVGRLNDQKNPLLLISAFKRIVSEKADAILLMLGRTGDSETEQGIFREIAMLQPEHKIFYLGEKLNVTDYLKQAHFFCLSSRYEGMPISLIEAFENGLIPVVTPVGAMPEMIGANGFVSENDSEDSYYRALKKALALTDEEIAIQARKLKVIYEEKYEISACANNYEQLYLKIINNSSEQ